MSIGFTYLKDIPTVAGGGAIGIAVVGIVAVVVIIFFGVYCYLSVFSCDSSSISGNIGMSVCQSVRNEFYRSVMLLIVYICCFYCCSLDY